jgi:hypothetical protein
VATTRCEEYTQFSNQVFALLEEMEVPDEVWHEVSYQVTQLWKGDVTQDPQQAVQQALQELP